MAKKEFDKEKLTKIVNDLSFPRLSGSEGGNKSIHYCKTLFNDINITFQEDKFNATKFWVGTILQLGVLFAIVLISLMTYLFLTVPWANLIIIIVIIALIIAALPKVAGSGDLKPVGKLIESKNLWATIAPKNEKKGFIIVSGHHDTKSQPLTTLMRSICFAIGGIGLLITILLFLIAMVIDLMGDPIPSGLKIAGLVFSIITIIIVIPLVFNGVGNKSPGALDNASSIAVLYEITKYFNENPLSNYEIVILITDAEELGMMGARAWVKEHINEFPPDKTYNINIDMVGWNDVDYIQVMTSVGVPKKIVSKKLNDYAFEVAKENRINLKGFWMPIGAATDSGVFAAKGYERTDFVVMAAATKTHRKNDTPDKFSGENAAENCQVIAGLIEKLDTE